MDGKLKTRFNVRVYGILISEGRVLLADERIKGFEMTKFPGGGLEFGEGTADCLIREMKEETGEDFSVRSHFYTTDFFQISAFDPYAQIISIYYLLDKGHIRTDLLIASRSDLPEGAEMLRFRWMDIALLTEEDLTFPIDRKVALMIKENFS